MLILRIWWNINNNTIFKYILMKMNCFTKFKKHAHLLKKCRWVGYKFAKVISWVYFSKRIPFSDNGIGVGNRKICELSAILE